MSFKLVFLEVQKGSSLIDSVLKTKVTAEKKVKRSTLQTWTGVTKNQTAAYSRNQISAMEMKTIY